MCICKLTEEDTALFEKIAKNIKEIVAKGNPITFKKDQVLFYKGHLPYGFFYIKTEAVSGSHRKCGFVGLEHMVQQTPFCQTVCAEAQVPSVFISKNILDQ